MSLDPSFSQRVFVKRNLFQVVALHVVVIALVPRYFSWTAWLFQVFFLILFGFSMSVIHHMLLSHRSFKARLWVERIGALLGTLTWRGPFAAPIRYVAMHRIHHKYADTDLDPHSPAHGSFHALLGWYWWMPKGFTDPELYSKYAGSIAQDPWHRYLDRNVDLIQLYWGILCFLLGALLFDVETGIGFVVYGVFLKSLAIIYIGNAVDAFNHGLGYRNYDTPDRSTNSFLMAAVQWGGAVTWHNNHHAHPAFFTVKRNWWEFDVYYLFLKGAERLSLVSDIKVLEDTA